MQYELNNNNNNNNSNNNNSNNNNSNNNDNNNDRNVNIINNNSMENNEITQNNETTATSETRQTSQSRESQREQPRNNINIIENISHNENNNNQYPNSGINRQSVNREIFNNRNDFANVVNYLDNPRDATLRDHYRYNYNTYNVANNRNNHAARNLMNRVYYQTPHDSRTRNSPRNRRGRQNNNFNTQRNNNNNSNSRERFHIRPFTAGGAGAGAGLNNIFSSLINESLLGPQDNFSTSASFLFTPVLFNNGNLSPVSVRPSREQITNAVETINFNNSIQHSTCPITQTPFQNGESISRIIHCGHCFNTEALNNWFGRSVLCPMCRYDIREYTQNNNIHRNNNMHENNNIHENNSSNIPPGLDISNNLIRTTSIESTASDNSADNTTFNMQGLLNTITSQLSENLNQQLLRNDISFNNLQNRFIDVEYLVENTQNGMRYAGRNRRTLIDPINPTNQESSQTTEENQLQSNIIHNTNNALDNDTNNDVNSDINNNTNNELSIEHPNNEETNNSEIIENNETDNDDDDVDTTVIY